MQSRNVSSNEFNNMAKFRFKLHYIGRFSNVTQKRVRGGIIWRYCKNIDFKLVFSSFKMVGLKRRE